MLQATEKQRKEYGVTKEDTFRALFSEFDNLIPPDMADNEVVVALAWEYGVSPEIIQRLYIQYLDGVS